MTLYLIQINTIAKRRAFSLGQSAIVRPSQPNCVMLALRMVDNCNDCSSWLRSFRPVRAYSAMPIGTTSRLQKPMHQGHGGGRIWSIAPCCGNRDEAV